MSPEPLVSVIIPVYNREHLLPATLDSVLNQTYAHFEVIVVDDGSSDHSVEIAQEYAWRDTRVKIVTQANQGPAAARNHGISLAKGQFIAFLDADDLMHPNRLEAQLQVCREHPEVDFVYCALTLIDDKGHEIGTVNNISYPQEDFLAWMLFRNQIPTASVWLVRAECFKEHGFDPSLRHAEDYDLALRLAHHYRFFYLDRPLTFYRRHAGNLSNQEEKHHLAGKKILSRYSANDIDAALRNSTFSPIEKLLMKGKILLNDSRVKEAADCFDAAGTPEAFFYRGNCCLHEEQWGQAVTLFQKALSQGYDNVACLNNLGVAYAKSGDKPSALRFFQQVLSARPELRLAQYNIDHPDQPKILWRELRQKLF